MHDGHVGDDHPASAQVPQTPEHGAFEQDDLLGQHPGRGLVVDLQLREQGAEVIWVDGTYDDAVDAAATRARGGAGILVADTTDNPNDPVVRVVMAGYGVMATEIRAQVEAAGHARPTLLFVQAGVSGLAAALATGNVETTAEMLSCGKASAPALAILRKHHVRAISVPESVLDEAPALLRNYGGPETTFSGAASLAGAMAMRAGEPGLPADARVLILITEREIETAA